MPRSAAGRCYLVCSPEYGTVVEVIDFGQGPMECGRDVLFAYARNAGRAKVLAVRAWRRAQKKNWRVARFLSHTDNPFTGIEVKRAVCEHGNQYHCAECEALWKSEEAAFAIEES